MTHGLVRVIAVSESVRPRQQYISETAGGGGAGEATDRPIVFVRLWRSVRPLSAVLASLPQK